MECKHKWEIFHDTRLKGTKYLSFYCKKCLSLKKVEKEYKK